MVVVKPSFSIVLRNCCRKLFWYFSLLHFLIVKGKFLRVTDSLFSSDLVIGCSGSLRILASLCLPCFTISSSIVTMLYFARSSLLTTPIVFKYV